jgi:hypothetical protein
MIRKGDIVTIKPRWRDAGDDKYTFVARSDEQNGVFDMSAIELAHMRIWPCQITRADMVEQTGRRIEA